MEEVQIVDDAIVQTRIELDKARAEMLKMSPHPLPDWQR